MQSTSAKRWIPFDRFFCHVGHTTFQTYSLSLDQTHLLENTRRQGTAAPSPNLPQRQTIFTRQRVRDRGLDFPFRRSTSSSCRQSRLRGPDRNLDSLAASYVGPSWPSIRIVTKDFVLYKGAATADGAASRIHSIFLHNLFSFEAHTGQ